jgi:hypothetical protein
MDEEGLTAVSNSSSGLWVTGGFTESGSNVNTAYAARLTGKKRTLFRLPEQVLYANPTSVAASPSGAWIAGNYGSPDQAAHWNGKKWSPALIGKIDPDSDPGPPGSAAWLPCHLPVHGPSAAIPPLPSSAPVSLPSITGTGRHGRCRYEQVAIRIDQAEH